MMCQVGITSVGSEPPCADPTHPAINVDVSSLLDWVSVE